MDIHASTARDCINKIFKSLHLFKFNSKNSGFTLIELIVVIVMFGVLILGLIFVLKPVTQINKGKDLQRQHDIGQIKSALDAYYNDTGCYPTSLTFGSSWKSGSTTYMTKVPQDPDYVSGSTSNLSYVYQTDGSSCPQWNVLYAGLRGPIGNSVACPLSQRAVCLPQGFNAFYNLCMPSGSVDCSVVASSALDTGNSGGGSGGSGGNGNSSPTATPTPYVIVCPGDNYYGCTGNNACNSIYPKEGKCVGYGGSIQCYCDSLCRVNGIKQCAN